MSHVTLEYAENNLERQPLDNADIHKVTQLPVETLGINTASLLKFSEIALSSTLMPARIAHGLELLPQAVKFIPLIEGIQNSSSNNEFNEPYREILREVSPKIAIAEKIASKLGKNAVKYLDSKIESKIMSSVSEAADSAGEQFNEHIEDLEHIAKFDNPSEQFTAELSLLSTTVNSAVRNERDLRVSGNATEFERRVPGIKGFVINVVKKVKGFFNRIFGRKEEQQQEVTANDAGAGIDKVVRAFKNKPEAMGIQFPLINRFIQKALPRTSNFYPDYYSLAAPEILKFLYSGALTKDRDEKLLESIERNPHDLRFVVNLRRFATRMTNIQAASLELIPAFKNVLPTNNLKLRGTIDQIYRLFNEKDSLVPEQIMPLQNETKLNRVKAMFGRIKSKVKTQYEN